MHCGRAEGCRVARLRPGGGLCLLLKVLRENYPVGLQERFGLEELNEDNIQLLEMIGKRRGCLVKGGAIDYEKAERLVLSEYRAGKLGRITLDILPGIEN